MAITLNVALELVVYEKFPKLCDYIIHNMAGSWTDECLRKYIKEQGYDIMYHKSGGLGCGYSRYITFEDDKQYLDFALRYS